MLNAVMLQGRIGNDTKLETSAAGTAYCHINLAVQRDVPNANGERITDWIRCTAFGKTAELIAKHFTKGSMILATGRLCNNEYTAQDGSRRSNTALNIDRVYFCEQQKNAQNVPSNASQTHTTNFEEISDDDLPF